MLAAMRWLLPWLYVFLVSSTIAYAADQALVNTLREPSESSLEAQPTPRPGYRWMLIKSIEHEGVPGNTLACQTRSNSASTDVIYVRAQEMNDLVVHMCERVWHGDT